eukprot:m.141665 g.141665  ORF g.141665 m.141665 type:complete len:70 (+) comp30202_c0_seq2:78-287(+)
MRGIHRSYRDGCEQRRALKVWVTKHKRENNKQYTTSTNTTPPNIKMESVGWLLGIDDDNKPIGLLSAST